LIMSVQGLVAHPIKNSSTSSRTALAMTRGMRLTHHEFAMNWDGRRRSNSLMD